MGNKSKQQTNLTKRDVFRWTEDMDGLFIDALVRQQRLGNRVDGVFTTVAYDNMLMDLHDKIRAPFCKQNLKNRLKTLKNTFKDCFHLFNGAHGFVWSPETKKFTATPHAWKAFVKEKPDAKKWMHTHIPHYDKLSLIFANNVNQNAKDDKNKKGGLTSCRSPNFFQGIEIPDDMAAILDDLNETNEQNSGSVSPERLESATSSQAKKRKLPEQGSELEFRSISKAIKNVAEAIREGNGIAERGHPHVYSEQQVYAELMKTGIQVSLRYKAYTFLIADPCKVRAFFGCPPPDRKDFLVHLMNNKFQ